MNDQLNLFEQEINADGDSRQVDCFVIPPKPGDIVYSKSYGYPYMVIEVLLIKDYPDDPEATEDLISLKKHKSFPGYKTMKQYERDFTAMWSFDMIKLKAV